MSLTRLPNKPLTRDLTVASSPFIRNQSAGGGGGAAPDPTFANTVMVQSNFEGTEDALVGEADDKHATSWTSGGATYQDTGAGALFGSNRAYISNITNWIGVASGAVDINTQDFAVEAIVELFDITASRPIAASRATGATNKSWELWWDQSANELVWEDFTDGNIGTKAQIRWSFTPVAGTVYEIAVGRDTNGIRCLVDGVQIGADQAHAVDIFWKSGLHVFLGFNNDSDDVRYGKNYYDCFRFTVGECHIVANYTARTGSDPYPTS